MTRIRPPFITVPIYRRRTITWRSIVGFARSLERMRSSTLVYLRTDVKSAIRRLREELPELDQMLIILRIDKRMKWRDIVAAVSGDDLEGDALKREAARLRKRFECAIERLRKLDEEIAKDKRKNAMMRQLGEIEERTQREKQDRCSHMRFPAGSGRNAGDVMWRIDMLAEWLCVDMMSNAREFFCETSMS